MKIISLLGSPHGLKGNTAKLLRHVLAGAESEGAQTEVVVLRGSESLCHVTQILQFSRFSTVFFR